MKKTAASLLACLCLASLIAVGSAANSNAATPLPEEYKIYGPVTKEGENRLHMVRQDQDGAGQDIILNVSPDNTRILDAVTGFPVAADQIRDNETVYAYIGPAVTMSLPPIGSAHMVLCNIPADYKVPEYVTVSSVSINSDGSTGTLKADGADYRITSDSQVLPYLTRNIVTIQDLTQGRKCLVWTEAGSNQVTKLVLFPSDRNQVQTGWVKTDGTWYYYDENGQLFTGWLNDNGSWYYLDPSDGAMKTGFLTLDGKTYYLQDDGKMMTGKLTFTTDKNGVLH